MRTIVPDSHKIGVALRASHFNFLEGEPNTSASWLEIPTEEFLTSRGRPIEVLELIRSHFPIALHGSAMNIGNPEGLRLDYLQKLKDLSEQFEPFMISDHLCWTGVSNQIFHEFLPLPRNEDSIATVVKNIDFAQNFLRRPLAFENVRGLFGFQEDQMSEWSFFSEISRRTGCKITIDLENLYFNSLLHDFDAIKYLSQISFDQVAQIHLSAPHTDSLFNKKVWELFSVIAPFVRHLPITIEHEEDNLNFEFLEKDLKRALSLLETPHESERYTELT